MPSYRIKLKVEITTRELIIDADDRDSLGKKVDHIDLRELLRSHSDGLHVTYLGDVQRVFDQPESDIVYNQKEEKLALPPKRGKREK